jgi:hypothetical protein
MDSGKLNDWMQVVAIFALVASLIFIGLQMMQSQEIAIATQYHNRAAVAVENYNAQLESGLLRFWGQMAGNGGPPGMSVEDKGRLYLSGMAYLVQVDNHYFQYQSGFLDEEAWQAQYLTLKNALGRPESPVRTALSSGAGLRASFIAPCHQIIEENASQESAQ